MLAALSLVVHIPLYFFFRGVADNAPDPDWSRFQKGHGDTVYIHTIPPKKEPDIPPDAQLVATPAQEHIADAQPVQTKFLSDKTTRTEKETRSEVSAPAKPTHGNPKTEPPKKPSAVQAAAATSSKETTSPKKSDELQLAAGGTESPATDRGKVPRSTMERPGAGGKGNGILLPSTSEGAALANLQALGGGEEYTSSDYLPGVDRGKRTMLNADQYANADFYMRVKGQVEKHWRPSDVYLSRDPNGQAYGVKDRYTVLHVEIDKGGKIVSVTVWRQSGLDFMDQEAKRAMRAAAPFLNPPADKFEHSATMAFEFGFYFEITGAKYRFNWRPL